MVFSLEWEVVVDESRAYESIAALLEGVGVTAVRYGCCG